MSGKTVESDPDLSFVTIEEVSGLFKPIMLWSAFGVFQGIEIEDSGT
ncbi:MAG: hypothetical protein ACJA01_002155 [Saprospiraceae bacterium]|jgi:hypothetical protein